MLFAQINETELKNRIENFFDMIEEKSEPLSIFPGLYEPFENHIEDLEDTYIRGLNESYSLDEVLLGEWEFYYLGNVENTSQGVFATDTDLNNAIKNEASDVFLFQNYAIMEDEDQNVSYWVTISDTSMILIDAKYDDEMYEINLTKISDNEYIMFWQDLYELPQFWTDIGLMRKR